MLASAHPPTPAADMLGHPCVSTRSADRPPAPTHGAYGLRLVGLGASPLPLVAAPPAWPEVEVIRRRREPLTPRNSVDADRFALALATGGQLVVERAASRCVFTTPEPLTDAELVHPFLAPVGACFAWWRGGEALHAGAVMVGSGVLALIGDRGSGKSSLVASLAKDGLPVVCDDMLVVEAGRAIAGPRCVDLRASAAEQLGVGDFIAIAGPRERWRVPLGPIEAELPFLGSVFLEWGDKVDVVRVGPSERLVRLARHRSLRLEPLKETGWLELVSHPAWQLTRPKSWSSLPAVTDRLMSLSSG